MTDMEKKYLERFRALIETIVPTFKDADEQINFYQRMKSEGLDSADLTIKKCDSLIEEIKTKFGSNSEIYKELSDDLVRITTDFIYVEINPNTLLAGTTGLNATQKSKINTQNQLAISLLNRLEKYYKGEKNKEDIQTIKNKVFTIEKHLNPKSSCYIATIIYNDYSSPEVCILREFRDSYLKTKSLGRLFINLYYNSCFIFHPLVKNNFKLQKHIKKLLDKIILKINKK